MTDLDLDALEATAKAATPGPWRWDEDFGENGDTGLALTNDARAEVVGAYNWHCCSFRDDPTVEDNDAEHIAAFDPPTVLALVAELRVLRESNSAEGRAIARSTVHAADALGGLRLYLGAEMVKLGYAGLRAKLREAEAVIAEVLELIATVKVAGEVPVDVFAIERILARSKPTNQEGES